MGSNVSTLQPMDDNTANNQNQNQNNTTITTTEATTSTSTSTAATQQQINHHRRRSRAISATEHNTNINSIIGTHSNNNNNNNLNDDQWWWEIENENLILDQVPNITTNLISESGILSDDFNRLLRINENINQNEQILENSQNVVNTVNTELQRTIADTTQITPRTIIEAVTIMDKSTESSSQSDAIPSIVSSVARDNVEVVNDDSDTTKEMEEFKAALRVKRLARQSAVQDLRDEITSLRNRLSNEQALTQRLRRSTSNDSNNNNHNNDVDNKQEIANKETFNHKVNKDDIESTNNNNKNNNKQNIIVVGNEEDTNASCNIEDEEILGACGGGGDDNDDLSKYTRKLKDISPLDDNRNNDDDDVDGDDADDSDPMSRGRHANIELANAQLSLQLANADNLSLRTELGVVKRQVVTLKEVITCCKQMLAVKEEQCDQLKAKLSEIETSFSEREMKIMSTNLREEYEKQLQNMKQLRQLYEERQRVAAAEHENLQRLISIKKDELQGEQEKSKNALERNETLMKEIESANIELGKLREECNEHKFEKKTLKEEMGAVNTLFSQMVMGFNGKNNLDIDRLTTMLEENRTLLNDMAIKEGNCLDGATLPKLLFELVEQASVANTKITESTTDEEETEETAVAATDDVNATCIATGINKTLKDDGSVAVTEDDNAQITFKDDVDNVLTSTLSIKENANVDNNKMSANKKLKKTKTKLSTSSAAATTSTIVCGCRGTNTGDAAAAAAAAVGVGGGTLKFYEPEVIGKVASTQEIIGNLPKVWKVLMELLSHHKIEQVQFEENGAGEDCYKTLETANGQKPELSVSKTYIKLKDLILEKKSLVKETNRLKTLNCHLEYRLNEQEKRLSAVSMELTKTWHLVGKMQRQHRQLHTQEQILRYQLQQKRRLLSELKDELEYCRRKWAVARAKNDESQEQYNDLRREFAKRKLDDANNSAESGYSDSGPPSDEERDRITNADKNLDREQCAAVAVGVGVGASAGVGAVDVDGRGKHLKEMFEHTTMIKRMQSTSPRRATVSQCDQHNDKERGKEIVLRWNSAPPMCGDTNGDADGDDEVDLPPRILASTSNRGAIPKAGTRLHTKQRDNEENNAGAMTDDYAGATASVAADDVDGKREERATRIQRLEEQCKSLIQQVIETSDNRERLEIQLCKFQDEIAPVQYAIPFDQLIKQKRFDRMTRARSVPTTGTLTPREEEYTRKRSERLERLEEESRQLMSRIKRTSDRGHYLRCSLDRIRRAPLSRDGSLESNTEDESSRTDVGKSALDTTTVETTAGESNINAVTVPATKNILTENEEAYTARRAARLQRLEAESRQLMSRLTRNSERGTRLGNKLDILHERYGSNETNPNDIEIRQATEIAATATTTPTPTIPTTTTTTTTTTIEERMENMERISTNRDERLRILEEEGKQLLTLVTNASVRGTQMINRIAEREARINAQTNRSDVAASNAQTPRMATFDKNNNEIIKDNQEHHQQQQQQQQQDDVTATELMPMPKNVACTSIVHEELRERVIVTTTPSQIASQQHGAIPKIRMNYNNNNNNNNNNSSNNNNGNNKNDNHNISRSSNNNNNSNSNSNSNGKASNSSIVVTRPVTQLCAARQKQSKTYRAQNESETETLEEMVRRLRNIPFPTTDANNEADSNKDEHTKEKPNDEEC